MIRAEGDEYEAAWKIQRATAVLLGLAEGAPVIVRAIDSSVGRAITRVSLEDGTSVPGEGELIDRETA